MPDPTSKTDKVVPPRHRQTSPEDINPAPLLGRVGDGATLPAGEAIAHEIQDLLDRTRTPRDEQETDAD